MTKEHLNVYIQKEDSIYLKGWAILIMVYLHVFGARAIDLPAYQSIHDVYIHGELLSYILSKLSAFKAAAIFPGVKEPSSIPKSSPRATLTAGAH